MKAKWEKVPDEDLWQDGELNKQELDADVKYKIKIGYYKYHPVLMRRTDVGLMELERWADND